MPKKPSVRKPIGSQQVKRFETLLKSARKYFCHIFLSLWEKISLKNSVFLVSEILRLFVNILRPDEPIQMDLLKNLKIFSEFFSKNGNLHKILNTLEKNMSLRGYWFLKL